MTFRGEVSIDIDWKKVGVHDKEIEHYTGTFHWEQEKGRKWCSLCFSKSQLIFPVRQQRDIEPHHPPPLNVIPPFAQNHLHYSSELWICSPIRRKPPGRRLVSVILQQFSPSWQHTSLRLFQNFRSSCTLMYLALKFKSRICHAMQHQPALQDLTTLQESWVRPCLIYWSWDFGEARCCSWFRAFHLHLTLQCGAVTSSAYVFHSMSHSTCISQHKIAGGIESSNYIHRCFRSHKFLFPHKAHLLDCFNCFNFQ